MVYKVQPFGLTLRDKRGPNFQYNFFRKCYCGTSEKNGHLVLPISVSRVVEVKVIESPEIIKRMFL